MAKETIHPIYLLKGSESVRRAEALAALVDRLTDPAMRDFDLERLDGRSLTAEQALAAAVAVPFASLRRVTVIDDAQRMSPDVAEALKERLPGRMNERATIIFVIGEYGEGEKVKGVKLRLNNLAKSLGQVLTFGPLKRNEAAAWLTEAANREGASMDAGARAELLARVGLNLGALQSEVEKLAAYAGQRKAITRADVVAVVPESTEYGVFTLVDAVSEGKAALALNTLRGLRVRNEPPQRILSLIARQYRLVWQARILMEDRSAVEHLPDEPNLLAQPPFVQEKARRQARGMTWERLRRGFRLMLEKDLAMKGIEGPPVGDDEALETLIIALCA